MIPASPASRTETTNSPAAWVTRPRSALIATQATMANQARSARSRGPTRRVWNALAIVIAGSVTMLAALKLYAHPASQAATAVAVRPPWKLRSVKVQYTLRERWFQAPSSQPMS